VLLLCSAVQQGLGWLVGVFEFGWGRVEYMCVVSDAGAAEWQLQQ
jgi:hypothetical protein